MSLYINTPALSPHSSREGFPGEGYFRERTKREGFLAYYSEDSGAVGVAVSGTRAKWPTDAGRVVGLQLQFVDLNFFFFFGK